MHESRTASPLAPPTAMRLTVRLAPQVEVLEQRCVDAEKTKEEAREAAAKVTYVHISSCAVHLASSLTSHLRQVKAKVREVYEQRIKELEGGGAAASAPQGRPSTAAAAKKK